jgi:hypothetical protein
MEILKKLKGKPKQEAPKAAAPKLMEIDLGNAEIQLGNVLYSGKVKVSPELADQLISMKPFAHRRHSSK